MANYVLDILVKATDQASGPLNAIGQSLGGLGSAASSGFGGLQKVVGTGLVGAFGLAAAGVGALGLAFRDSLDLARQQQDVEAQLAAVIKSTGGAAGLSAEQIKGMAKELQSVTNFGDDAILSGQNLLLTFTNIGEDVFPRATETMLDMATALGTDAKSGAIQLGKALNDPTEGISALTRVGVTFTEQQKEQIKAMQEAGDMAGAQTVILDELQKEFGGSARALADPADQLKNAWVDFKEVVGGSVLPMIEGFYSRILPGLQKATEKASKFVAVFFDTFENSDSILDGLKWALIETFGIGKNSPTIAAIDTIRKFWGVLVDTFENSDSVLEGVKWALIETFGGKEFLTTVFDIIESTGKLVTSFVSWKDVLIATGVVVASIVVPFLVGLVTAAAPIIAVAAALVGAVALLRTAWESDWGGIQGLVGGVIDSIVANYQGFVDGTLSLPEAIGGAFGGIVAAIGERLPEWYSALLGWGEAAWQWIVDAIPVVVAKIGEWYAGLRSYILTNRVGWGIALAGWAEAAWQWIAEAIPQTLSQLGRWATSLIGAVAAKLPDFLATIYGWATAIVAWIGEAIPKAINSLTKFVEDLGKEGDSKGQSTFLVMVGKWVGLLIDWVVNDLVPKVAPAFLEFLGAMVVAMGEISIALGKLALAIGTTIMDEIMAGLEAGWKGITTWFGGLRLPDVDLNPFDNNDIDANATGTVRSRGGMALVGEQGPEIVRLPPGAEVITAMRSREMMGRMVERASETVERAAAWVGGGGEMGMQPAYALAGAGGGGNSAYTYDQRRASGDSFVINIYGASNPQETGRAAERGVIAAKRRLGM